MNSDGLTYQSKNKPFKPFSLTVFKDLDDNVKGLSSIRRNDYLDTERKNWEKKIRDANPFLFSMLKTSYYAEYKVYMEDGFKDLLVSKLTEDSISNSIDPDVQKRKEVLNMEKINI